MDFDRDLLFENVESLPKTISRDAAANRKEFNDQREDFFAYCFAINGIS
jgi:hypothetical protein